MDEETGELMAELYKLCGRLRDALMEAQTGMSQIVQKAASVTGQPEGQAGGREGPRHDAVTDGYWRSQKGSKHSEDDKNHGKNAVEERLPRRIP